MTGLDDIRLLDTQGSEVRLGDLWADKPVALVFMRHYGCLFCREQVIELKRHEAELRSAGGEVVVIGMGTPEHAAHFQQQQELPFTLLVDRTRESYRAAGLKYPKMWEVTGPKVWWRGLKAVAKGARQGSAKQNYKQLGGTLVIAPGGEVEWTHKSKDSADNAPVDQIVSYLKAASPAPATA